MSIIDDSWERIRSRLKQLEFQTKGLWYHYKERNGDELSNQVRDAIRFLQVIDEELSYQEGFEAACEDREREDNEGVTGP